MFEALPTEGRHPQAGNLVQVLVAGGPVTGTRAIEGAEDDLVARGGAQGEA